LEERPGTLQRLRTEIRGVFGAVDKLCR